MTCASCKFDNPSAARFCEQCGTALELKCTRCGATVSAGARFCGACGNQLARSDALSPEPTDAKPLGKSGPSANAFVPDVPIHLAEKILSGRAALEGERRQVTVMFGDLANYTALSEKLDPEEVHKIVQRCLSWSARKFIASKALSTNTAVMGSWRCSERRLRTRTRRGAPSMLRWQFSARSDHSART